MCCFPVPEENVATPQYDAITVEGQVRGALLNGDTENYNGEQGYTTHTITQDQTRGITVQLSQPYIINCIRMLLWDRDNRCWDALQSSVFPPSLPGLFPSIPSIPL